MHKSSLKESLVKTYHDVEEGIEAELYERWHIRLHRKAKHHVHRLRKKSDNHKDLVAFGVAFSLTLIVFIGWYFISFPKIMNSYYVNQRENTALDISGNPFQGATERLQENENITAE